MARNKFLKIIYQNISCSIAILVMAIVLAITGCKQVSNPSFQLELPQFNVSGMILDKEGNPVEGAELTLHDSGILIPITYSDKDGNYSFTDVNAGNDLYIEVSLFGFESTTIIFSVSDNITDNNIELVKLDGVAVLGTILMDYYTNNPPSDAIVELIHDGKVALTVNVSNVDGSYKFDHVPIGESYQLRVVISGSRVFVTDFDIPENVETEVTMEPIALEKSYSIKGSITTDIPQGVPVYGAMVQLFKDGDAYSETYTDPFGCYTIKVVQANTNYSIEVSLGDEYIPETSTPFDIVDSNIENLDFILSRIVYTISGTVSLNNPETPAVGALVKLLHKNYVVNSTAADSNGYYSFSDVFPGSEYKIAAYYDDYDSQTTSSFDVYSSDVSKKNLTLLSKYSLADLENAVQEDWCAVKTELTNYGAYAGRVIKVAPLDGRDWGNTNDGYGYSLPIIVELDDKPEGLYRLTISMSVWMEKPLISAFWYSGPPQIVWRQRVFHSWKNNDYIWLNWGSPLYIQNDWYNSWQDLEFTGYVNIGSAKYHQVNIDGLNEEQGLVDVSLYFRHFKVTVEPHTGDKLIALTFDDGPFTNSNTSTGNTSDLLDLLQEKGIKASFFMNGMRIDGMDPENDKTGITLEERNRRRAEREALVARMFAEGHDVANHSYSHNYLSDEGDPLSSYNINPTVDIPNLTSLLKELQTSYFDTLGYPEKFNYSRSWPLSQESLREEIIFGQRAIQRAVGKNDSKGWVSRYFRIPFALRTNVENLKMVAGNLDLPIIYGLGSGDYNGLSGDEIANFIYNERAPYTVIICHDPPTGKNTIAALEKAIPKLQADGYRFVTLSEMETNRGRNLKPGVIYWNLDPDYRWGLLSTANN